MLDDLTMGLGKAIKTVPDLYDDALKPTAQESGKTLSLVPRTINAALLPLRKWILQQEYNFSETEKLLAKKLEHVDENKIVTPEPHIAVPVLQALSYSMDSDELRNLYANLLAKAMNIDTKNLIHPAFVEIIKQFSPVDAYILREINPSKSFPVITISVNEYSNPVNTGDFLQGLEIPKRTYSYPNITYIQHFSYSEISTSINNLTRLGLVEISLGNEQNESYDLILNSPVYKNLEKQLKSYITKPYQKYEKTYESLFLNNFSRQFRDICIRDL